MDEKVDSNQIGETRNFIAILHAYLQEILADTLKTTSSIRRRVQIQNNFCLPFLCQIPKVRLQPCPEDHHLHEVIDVVRHVHIHPNIIPH